MAEEITGLVEYSFDVSLTYIQFLDNFTSNEKVTIDTKFFIFHYWFRSNH